MNSSQTPVSIFKVIAPNGETVAGFANIEDAKEQAEYLASTSNGRYYISQLLGYVEPTAPPTKWTYL
jgi:hypothetical protein